MPHIALIPFEDRCHVMQLLLLAKKLAAMDIEITFIFPDTKSHSLITSQSLDPAADGLDITFTVLEDEEVSNSEQQTMNAGGEGPLSADQRKERALDRMLGELAKDPEDEDDPLPVVAVVADIMVPWVRPVAKKLLLPRYVFYSSAATNLAATCQVRPEGQSERREASEHHAWREDLQDAEGILVNTSEALESRAINAMNVNAGHKEWTQGLGPLYVLAIGPIVPSSYFDENITESIKASTVVPSSDEALCKDWMDKQKPGSVVYVSFGSRSSLPDEQIREVAFGLEASKQPFLWLLPPSPKLKSSTQPSSEYLDGVLPEGFADRTKEQGLVLTSSCSALQHQLILAHPSLGGLVTHCDWNSVLECMCLAAVPMLCWPLDAEQQVICRFLVDEAKVGLELGKGDNKGTLDRGDVAKLVRMLFGGPEAGAMRQKLAELRDGVRKSVGKDGSSMENLWRFVGDLYT